MRKNKGPKRLRVIPTITARDPQRHVSNSSTYVIYNADTGEEVERFEVDGRQMPQKDDWMRLYQDFAGEIANEHGRFLTALQYRLLFLVVQRAGFGNHLTLCLSDIARGWRVSRESVSRAMRTLERIGAVERLQSGKGTMSVRINPNFAWKGSDHLRRARVAKWAEERKGSVPGKEGQAS